MSGADCRSLLTECQSVSFNFKDIFYFNFPLPHHLYHHRRKKGRREAKKMKQRSSPGIKYLIW